MEEEDSRLNPIGLAGDGAFKLRGKPTQTAPHEFRPKNKRRQLNSFDTESLSSIGFKRCIIISEGLTSREIRTTKKIPIILARPLN